MWRIHLERRAVLCWVVGFVGLDHRRWLPQLGRAMRAQVRCLAEPVMRDYTVLGSQNWRDLEVMVDLVGPVLDGPSCGCQEV
jgi:hypothetical protein